MAFLKRRVKSANEAPPMTFAESEGMIRFAPDSVDRGLNYRRDTVTPYTGPAVDGRKRTPRSTEQRIWNAVDAQTGGHRLDQQPGAMDPDTMEVFAHEMLDHARTGINKAVRRGRF